MQFGFIQLRAACEPGLTTNVAIGVGGGMLRWPSSSKRGDHSRCGVGGCGLRSAVGECRRSRLAPGCLFRVSTWEAARDALPLVYGLRTRLVSRVPVASPVDERVRQDAGRRRYRVPTVGGRSQGIDVRCLRRRTGRRSCGAALTCAAVSKLSAHVGWRLSVARTNARRGRTGFRATMGESDQVRQWRWQFGQSRPAVEPTARIVQLTQPLVVAADHVTNARDHALRSAQRYVERHFDGDIE